MSMERDRRIEEDTSEFVGRVRATLGQQEVKNLHYDNVRVFIENINKKKFLKESKIFIMKVMLLLYLIILI